MSIFVAGLAFKEEALLNMAKLGIFTASLLAGIVGSVSCCETTRRLMTISAKAGKHEQFSATYSVRTRR